MKKLFNVLAIAIILLIPMHAVGASGNVATPGPASPSLLNMLRQGGYILYVRHGEATVGADQPNVIFDDCKTQKNLSEEGKKQAELFGNLLRSLRIPVQIPVQASPLCRTRDSAALAFGADNVQVDPDWIDAYRLSGDITQAEKERILVKLNDKLEKVPPPGQNQVVVAHSFPQGIGLGEISDFGTVIVRPKGQGKGYDIIDKLTLAEWESIQ
ncbi:histidine phosphatase family protein [Cohnella cholangitidis]|uniref:Histidine phosphatase family protein n=1 Tax=Cohnella cholangitidis TaxID=2598458 RepID=A0A7G5C095_9BACL|nr:histidine phosphatase family protein [Cohnella cholangitidis]QMV42629.1 histidine phosphatase family protein [Cohnella cholangitidis]